MGEAVEDLQYQELAYVILPGLYFYLIGTVGAKEDELCRYIDICWFFNIKCGGGSNEC